jgi:hypothetical protein
MKTKGIAWLPVLLVVAAMLAIGSGTFWYSQSDTSATHVTETAQTADQTESVLRPVNKAFAVDTEHAYCTGCMGKSDRTIIEGADVKTFIGVGTFEAKDANHTYGVTAKGYLIIDGVETGPNWPDQDFSLLWDAIPGRIQFFRNESKIVRYDVTTGTYADVERGDPATFQTIFGSYNFAPWAKDKNQIYCNGDPIQYSDPTTARLTTDSLTLEFNTNGIDRVYDSSCLWVKYNSLSATPLGGKAPLSVHFMAEPSPGEEFIRFGDGTTWNQYSDSTETDHVYKVPGTYVVQLYRSFPSVQIGEVRITVTQ